MLRLYIRKLFFTMKTGRQWSRLTGEVVQALSLEVFKEELYLPLSNWSELTPELGLHRSLNWRRLEVLSNLLCS